MSEEIKVLPQASFVEATKKGFTNLFNFKGRTRRSEYWWFVLTVALISIIVSVIFRITYGSMTIGEIAEHNVTLYAILTFVIAILPAILLVANQVRRLHDVGKSALLPCCSFVCSMVAAFCLCYWNVTYFTNLAQEQIPSNGASFNIYLVLVGLNVILQLIILVYTLKDSQKIANRYGESPKYVA